MSSDIEGSANRNQSQKYGPDIIRTYVVPVPVLIVPTVQHRSKILLSLLNTSYTLIMTVAGIIKRLKKSRVFFNNSSLKETRIGGFRSLN